MSSIYDERSPYPELFFKREFGDFSAFYAVIAICTVFAFFLVALNVTFCCSRYREYWCDSNTGNRWILPLWTKTPKQPPLDFTELDEAWIPEPETEYYYPDNYSDFEQPPSRIGHDELVELVQQHKPYIKKESDL